MGFSRFNLSPDLFRAVTALGYAEPTPVQASVIPEAMKGRDIRACAQTGTGKTCAFVIPVLEKLLRDARANRPRALILTPTRELAAQVVSVVQDLAKHTRIKTALILGGANFNQQMHQLRAGAEVVVATPGRLLDHMEQRTVSLREIHTLVLDEGDRMLDMGFMPAIRKIMAELPERRQSMLFSATFGSEIQQLIRQVLKNPFVVDLAPSAPSQNVTQLIYSVPREQKTALLQALFELNNMTSAIIFTRTKHGADRLARNLGRIGGKSVAVIHSNRSQNQRQEALRGFKERRFQVLVATDIAARGIDVKDISHVINFDVPEHPEDYVHRIGRTGRAQAVGEAFTLACREEEQYIKRIERLIGKSIPRGVIPDFPYTAEPRVFPSNTQPHGARSHGQPSHGNRPQRPHPQRPSAGGSPFGNSGNRHGGPGSGSSHSGQGGQRSRFRRHR